MYLRSHAQKYIPGVYLHVCKLYTRVNLVHANWTLHVFILLAHLSQRLIGKLIGYPWSVVRYRPFIHPFAISNVFFSETAWPIKAKFYVEPPWEGKLAAKVYIDWIILLMKEIWPQGVVCPCPGAIYMYISIIFKHVSETTWPINAKFHVDPFWEGRTKVYINGPGHMPRWLPCPYMVNPLKSSSPELEVLWSWNLACSIGVSSSTKFI